MSVQAWSLCVAERPTRRIADAIADARFVSAPSSAWRRQEATSALDYESEAVIQKNMRTICQGRTVIVIAHRLSAVRQANAIIVMEQGRLVEGGTHDHLLQQGGIYARLWALQSGTAPAGAQS